MLSCSPLFVFEKSIIPVKEIKMLELETLFMPINTVYLYEYGPDVKKMGKDLFKNIFEKKIKF